MIEGSRIGLYNNTLPHGNNFWVWSMDTVNTPSTLHNK